MDTSNRAGVFLSFCVCVAILCQVVRGDNIDCQDVQCLHPNVTNGKAKLVVNLQSTIASPFDGSYGNYGNYGQADEDGASESEYGNYGNYENDANGNAIKKYFLHARMTVRCNHGYMFRANFTGVITCQKSSSGDCDVGWSEDTSTLCSPVVCNPKALKNAKLTGTCDDVTTLTDPVLTNQTACLRCEDGFRLTGNAGNVMTSLMVRCKETGQWDTSAKCTNAIACPAPQAPKYGSIHSFDSMSRVEFGCGKMFLMVGSPTLECVRGNWSGLPPLCRFKASCLTNTLSNGIISTVDQRQMGPGPWVRNSTSAIYMCETGFTHLTDGSSILCVRGEWKPMPRCVLDKPFACPVLGAIANGTVRLTPSRILPGTEATVTCDSGFELLGSANHTCQENGSWSGSSSSCGELTRCTAPPVVHKASPTTSGDYMEGDVIRYSCKSGYNLVGKSRITCSKSGSWSDVDFQCTRVSCGTPSNIPNAIREGNSFRFGDEVTYKCQPGYKMTSGILTSRVCQPNRRWTVIGMKCEEARCRALPEIPHGTLEHTGGWSLKYRSTYRYVCHKGYKFSGADSGASVVELRCRGDQSWDGNVPNCEIVKCPVLKAPANGVLRPDSATATGGTGMEYGTGYAVGCLNGYKLKGKEPGEELLWLCQYDGTWSDDQAECQAMTCPRLTAPGHGELIRRSGTGITASEFAYGSEYRISCSYGYKLRGKEPNDYIWRLCKNDGTWNNTDDAFCEDRKIFLSRSEWAKFLTDRDKDCCPLWRVKGYKWDESRCSLNSGVKEECITSRLFRDEVCYRRELVNEDMTNEEKDQTWYALLGVKVPKYGNQCCWNHPKKGPYDCYEYPAELL